MNITIQATNVELTPAIAEYVTKKLEGIDKFIQDHQAASAEVEVAKTTDHHRSGDIYKAEVNVHLGGTTLRAVAEQEDLYAAIDVIKDEIQQELRSFKGKKETEFRKGAEELKRMLRESDE